MLILFTYFLCFFNIRGLVNYSNIFIKTIILIIHQFFCYSLTNIVGKSCIFDTLIILLIS